MRRYALLNYNGKNTNGLNNVTFSSWTNLDMEISILRLSVRNVFQTITISLKCLSNYPTCQITRIWLLETIRLTFTANCERQIFQGNFHTFSTAKLLIYASFLMYNTVQKVLNSNTKLLKSKYDLRFAVCGSWFAVNVNLKVPDY